MRRHLSTAGGGLAGIGLTSLLAYLIATTTSSVHDPPAWPYWLCGGIAILGVVLYLAAQPRPPLRRRRSGTADPDDPGEGPPITNRWRNTNHGSEVPRLMRIRDHSMSHPGFPLENAPPSMRTAMLVACDPLGPAPATSDIRASFLGFLGRQPISGFLSTITAVPDGFTWTAWGDQPRRVFGAVLNGTDQHATPIAWARLLLPEDGVSHTMHDPRCAELVLHAYPRAPGGDPAPAANLAAWHDRLTQALALPGALAHFLTDDLGLATTREPPAQIGVSLDTPHSMTELVDPQGIATLAGTSAPTWFLGWAVADPNGHAASGLTLTWLTQMCDSTLHLNGYEPVLRALTYSRQPPASTVPGPTLPSATYGALKLELVGTKWTLWQRTAWLTDIQVRITNTTLNRVIELTRFELESDPGPSWEQRPKMTQEQVGAVFQEMLRRREAYGPAHLRQMGLQPGDSRTGWFASHAYLPYPTRKGKPYCEFTVTDDEGETYTLPIPGQGPHACVPPYGLLRLRNRAIEGRRMRERLPADGSEPDDIELNRFEGWTVKVADALESQPDYLAQFQRTFRAAAEPDPAEIGAQHGNARRDSANTRRPHSLGLKAWQTPGQHGCKAPAPTHEPPPPAHHQGRPTADSLSMATLRVPRPLTPLPGNT